MTVDTTTIVNAIVDAEKKGMKVLVFVVPIDPEALENCLYKPSLIETRCQSALAYELDRLLKQRREPGQEQSE